MTAAPMPTGAFHGDPALKAALLDAIDRHGSAGKLLFDGTHWDGARGGPSGIAVGGDDPVAFADRYGFPLPLAPLWDGAVGTIDDRAAAIAATRAWIDAVPVGADLSQVPTRLVIAMLERPDTRGVDDALATALIGLHERDLTDAPAPRNAWVAIRQAILEQQISAGDILRRDVLSLWEAASWPAARGRSTLVVAFERWSHVRARGGAAGWTTQDEDRVQALLKRIWDENLPAIEADEIVPFKDLLKAADPDLAIRYETSLARSNRRFLDSGRDMVAMCISLFAQAPAAMPTVSP